MTTRTQDIERQIEAWRDYLGQRRAIGADDAEELESHLRDQIDGLTGLGLTGDEAFLIAVQRLGQLDDLSREFATEHSDRLWKHLVGAAPTGGSERAGLAIAGLASAAAATVGIVLAHLAVHHGDFVGKNVEPLMMACLAAYFLIRRSAGAWAWLAVAALFAAATLAVNLYPVDSADQTFPLVLMHVPVMLWLAVGVGYAAARWRSSRARMDFIRFTGEWFIYVNLIQLGGIVLVGVTYGVFSVIGIDATMFILKWLAPGGLGAALVVAAWLVESKQNVIENIAPVLARLFTPLFTALLLALIVAGAINRDVVGSPRVLLIIFDAVLIVVLALLLYTMSARDRERPATWFDWLQLVLISSALVVDLYVFAAIAGRLVEYGFSANKAASLGLNLILLVNLSGAAWLQWRFCRGAVQHPRLEQWQTSWLPVYLVWATVVVTVFPPAFGFS